MNRARLEPEPSPIADVWALTSRCDSTADGRHRRISPFGNFFVVPSFTTWGFEAKRMDEDKSVLNPQVGVALALIVGIILGSASLNLPRWNSIAQLFCSDTPTALPRDGSP
jgi:hypothetical protein